MPGRFTPGKETLYPLYTRVSEIQGQSGRVQKISPPLGFDPRNVEPAASRYTDWAIPDHLLLLLLPLLFICIIAVDTQNDDNICEYGNKECTKSIIFNVSSNSKARVNTTDNVYETTL
jgi:hypothetical protein